MSEGHLDKGDFPRIRVDAEIIPTDRVEQSRTLWILNLVGHFHEDGEDSCEQNKDQMCGKNVKSFLGVEFSKMSKGAMFSLWMSMVAVVPGLSVCKLLFLLECLQTPEQKKMMVCLLSG